jgi:cell wall-associated NlpC family hydrolase
MVLSGLGTMGSLVTGGGTSLMESSYLASDEEIYSAEEAYSALETALQTQLSTIESTYPGYDEYRYQVDEISHNPYQLASYLTVRYGAYTSDEVEPELAELFQAQYSITVESTTETTEEAEEGSESQTVTVLNVTLTNAGFDTVARNRLSEEEALNWYGLLNSAYGNRDYLWDTATYSGYTTGGISYEIPPEALEDEQFRNMITEAEKYLGYPYVWGGSSPSTSFDCSGFVSWVINNCGNGWSYGRLTANGLLGICTYVSPNEAQPGDLIFFQGTYDTTGASHVGIYVGGGAMIHCGNPIQYASVETSYWQQHFLCYGRIS